MGNGHACFGWNEEGVYRRKGVTGEDNVEWRVMASTIQHKKTLMSSKNSSIPFLYLPGCYTNDLQIIFLFTITCQKIQINKINLLFLCLLISNF